MTLNISRENITLWKTEQKIIFSEKWSEEISHLLFRAVNSE